MYECHLTYAKPKPSKEAAAAIQLLKTYGKIHGWKYSAINGDPILGPGTKLYLTCHDEDLRAIFRKMREATHDKRLPKLLRDEMRLYKLERVWRGSDPALEELIRRTAERAPT